MNEKTIISVTLFAVLLVGIVGLVAITKQTETAFVVQTTGPLSKPSCTLVGFTMGADGEAHNVIVQNWNVKSIMGGNERCRNIASTVFKKSASGGCMNPCTIEEAIDWALEH